MEKSKNRYWELFVNMLYISTFTFGGGFVIITLMQKKFVDDKGWLTEEEMMDMAAIAQSCPGAIAVNAAILVGNRIGGMLGILSATLGTIIPPIVIISAISFVYEAFCANPVVALLLKGMQAGVVAVILDVVVRLALNVRKEKSAFLEVIMLSAFCAQLLFDFNVILIILCVGVIGAIRGIIMLKKGESA